MEWCIFKAGMPLGDVKKKVKMLGPTMGSNSAHFSPACYATYFKNGWDLNHMTGVTILIIFILLMDAYLKPEIKYSIQAILICVLTYSHCVTSHTSMNRQRTLSSCSNTLHYHTENRSSTFSWLTNKAVLKIHFSKITKKNSSQSPALFLSWYLKSHVGFG